VIIRCNARQAPPRPESVPKGPVENQLTGPLPHSFPAVQSYGEFSAIEIPDPARKPCPRPVSAPFAQSAHPEITVELIAEDDPRAMSRPDVRLSGPEDSFFHSDAEAKTGKRRSRRAARGEDHGRAKLTEDKVATIRALSAETSVSELARIFEVSRTAVRKILRGDTWVMADDGVYTDETEEL
jgi:hypothetical protein